jgi:hypothetical protein
MLTGDSTPIPAGGMQQALDAGWSDQQLAELFVHLGVNMFSNYFNHYNHTDLDLPPAP